MVENVVSLQTNEPDPIEMIGSENVQPVVELIVIDVRISSALLFVSVKRVWVVVRE